MGTFVYTRWHGYTTDGKLVGVGTTKEEALSHDGATYGIPVVQTPEEDHESFCDK